MEYSGREEIDINLFLVTDEQAVPLYGKTIPDTGYGAMLELSPGANLWDRMRGVNSEVMEKVKLPYTHGPKPSRCGRYWTLAN